MSLRPRVSWPRRGEGHKAVGPQAGSRPSRCWSQVLPGGCPTETYPLRALGPRATPRARKERGLRKQGRVGTGRVGGVRTIQISGKCTSQDRPQLSKASVDFQIQSSELVFETGSQVAKQASTMGLKMTLTSQVLEITGVLPALAQSGKLLLPSTATYTASGPRLSLVFLPGPALTVQPWLAWNFLCCPSSEFTEIA